MISGKTTLIAHIGFPTEAFKAPMIYNPWFDRHGIDAAVIPMGVRPEDYATSLMAIFRMSNVRGALVTMPHKVVTNSLVDELTPTARIAGASNAILLRPDGTLLGDQFDGAGFVRGVQRKGLDLAGKRVLVSGNGGVGSAIAASLAAAGVARMALFDDHAVASQALAGRLREHYPRLEIGIGSNDPAGFDLIVNCTSLGLKPDDPLPFDPARVDAGAAVVDILMTREPTPLLRACRARGLKAEAGFEMLVQQVPEYLRFFGFDSLTESLRSNLDPVRAMLYPK